MAQVQIQGGIYFDADSIKYGPAFEPYKFFSGKLQTFSTYTPICAHTLTAELPDDFDPRRAAVAGLEAKRAKLRADFAAAVVDLDRQINSLLAIEGATTEQVEA